MCEVFERKRCFGCIGLSLEYDIDKIKYECETFKEEMKIENGEQQKWTI